MGLFSRRQRVLAPGAAGLANDGRIHVLIRSVEHAHSNGSYEEDLVWSLCVEQPSRKMSVADMKALHRKSSLNFLARKRKQSNISDISALGDDMTSQRNECVEFYLNDGNLSLSPPGTPLVNTFPVNFETPSQEQPLLVQITIPHAPSLQMSEHSLSNRVEQSLVKMTSYNHHLSNNETETWIRYALISLQHAGIVPQGQAFDINNFITFAQNKYTEFEAELLSTINSGTTDDESEHEQDDRACLHRTVDYQRHLNETARMTRMFSNSGDMSKFAFSRQLSHTNVYAQEQSYIDEYDEQPRSPFRRPSPVLDPEWCAENKVASDARSLRRTSFDSHVYY